MPALRNSQPFSRRSGRLCQKEPRSYQEDDWEVHDFLSSATQSHAPVSSSAPVYCPPTFSPSPSPLLSPAGKKLTLLKRASNHIPRPKNAFICFRSHYCAQYKKKYGEKVDHRIMSVEAGKRWRLMNEEEKEPFEELAKKEKRLHALQYPDYKYKPLRVGGSPTSAGPKRSMPRKAVKTVTPILEPKQVETKDLLISEIDKPDALDQTSPRECTDQETGDFVPTAEIPPLNISSPLLPGDQIPSSLTLCGPLPPQLDAYRFPSGLSYHEDFSGYIQKPPTPSISESEFKYEGAASFISLAPVTSEFAFMFQDFTLSSPPQLSTSASPPAFGVTSCGPYAMLSIPTPLPSTNRSSFDLLYPGHEEDDQEWMQYINLDRCS